VKAKTVPSKGFGAGFLVLAAVAGLVAADLEAGVLEEAVVPFFFVVAAGFGGAGGSTTGSSSETLST
jgi:uncharacterized membrane protein